MAKINCWQLKRCGREPDGARVQEFGVCPAATITRLDGVNHGSNGGRACWAIAGTLCGGQVQGTFAAKLPTCLSCDFYQLVRDEEQGDLTSAREILVLIG